MCSMIQINLNSSLTNSYSIGLNVNLKMFKQPRWPNNPDDADQNMKWVKKNNVCSILMIPMWILFSYNISWVHLKLEFMLL